MKAAVDNSQHTPGPVARAVSLQRVMQAAGWEIHYIDLDLTGVRPTAEIRVARDDGRWLFARVDARGRATVERFQRDISLGVPRNAKGRWPLSPQVYDEFLGRTSYPGARVMLRELTSYIALNASRPVTLGEVRSAWASVMATPLLLGSALAAATGSTQPKGAS